jgi:hypothetical protein
MLDCSLVNFYLVFDLVCNNENLNWEWVKGWVSYMMQYNIYSELQMGLLKIRTKKMGRIDIRPL